MKVEEAQFISDRRYKTKEMTVKQVRASLPLDRPIELESTNVPLYSLLLGPFSASRLCWDGKYPWQPSCSYCDYIVPYRVVLSLFDLSPLTRDINATSSSVDKRTARLYQQCNSCDTSGKKKLDAYIAGSHRPQQSPQLRRAVLPSPGIV